MVTASGEGGLLGCTLSQPPGLPKHHLSPHLYIRSFSRSFIHSCLLFSPSLTTALN